MSRRRGRKARMARTAPHTLTSMTFLHMPMGTHSTYPNEFSPALFTTAHSPESRVVQLLANTADLLHHTTLIPTSNTMKPVLNSTWPHQEPIFWGMLLQSQRSGVPRIQNSQVPVLNRTCSQQKNILVPCGSDIGRFHCAKKL